MTDTEVCIHHSCMTSGFSPLRLERLRVEVETMILERRSFILRFRGPGAGPTLCISHTTAGKITRPRDEALKTQREQDLEKALRELVTYTLDVLTGPIMSQFVTWPHGGPQAPALSAAKKLLEKVTCDEN